jgi:putative intracellular protease/amidase
MTRVLLVVTGHGKLGSLDRPTGWYLPEVAHPYHEFKKAGYEIVFASPLGGKTPMDPSSYNEESDEISKEFIKSDAFKQLETTKPVTECKAADYDLIFLAGGHGTVFDFPDDKNLATLIAKIYDKGGYVAAVCHGPIGLINVKLGNGEYLLKDKAVTGFSNEEEDAAGLTTVVPSLEDAMKARGGKYVPASPMFTPQIRADNRLFTGANPASASALAEEIVRTIASASK